MGSPEVNRIIIRLCRISKWFFPFLFLSGALFADIAILPFRVEGKPDLRYSSDPGVLLQEAIAFLFSVRKDYPVQSLPSTNAILRQSNFLPDHLLSRKKGMELCNNLGSDYFLTGSARFSPSIGVSIKVVTFSCRYNNSAVQKERSGRIASLQTMLNELIDEAAPFAPANPTTRSVTASEPHHLGIILDTSGSMVENFDAIESALRGLVPQMEHSSTIGLALLGETKNSYFPYSSGQNEFLKIIRRVRPTGNVRIERLEEALSFFEKRKPWNGKNTLLIFSDLSTRGKQQHAIETELRKLTKNGVRISLFTLSSQQYDDRLEWERLARTIGLDNPSILYAKRIGFLEGFSRMLIMDGARFYTADRDVSAEILANRLPDAITPVETIRYEKNLLNLNDMPHLYAKTEKLRIAGMGRTISGLERQITDSVRKTIGEATHNRVLLKNKGNAFWISVADDSLYRYFKNNRGRTLYVGVRLKKVPGALFPENIADEVYVKNQGDVPLLFINEWRHVRSVQDALRPEDIWFFLSTIQDTKDATENEDIRK